MRPEVLYEELSAPVTVTELMPALAATMRLISLKWLSTGILFTSIVIVNTFPFKDSVFETVLLTSRYSNNSCKLVTQIVLAEVVYIWSMKDLNPSKELKPCVPSRHSL